MSYFGMANSMDMSLSELQETVKDTGKPGMLQFQGLQRVGHNSVIEQQQIPYLLRDPTVGNFQIQFPFYGHNHFSRYFSWHAVTHLLVGLVLSCQSSWTVSKPT